MKEITIQIEDKTYNVQVVESEDEKVQGLSNTEELPLDGMLFDYSSDPQSELTFNTIDMNYPIDIIFINSNYEVTAVELGEPKSDEIIECIADEDESAAATTFTATPVLSLIKSFFMDRALATPWPTEPNPIIMTLHSSIIIT